MGNSVLENFKVNDLKDANAPLLALLSPQQSNLSRHRTWRLHSFSLAGLYENIEQNRSSSDDVRHRM